ncbi:MAG TPA: LysR family transcriptional regulator, partial [Kiloniellaceae bacterium]|nr:LysR family transcriptional regulator [Kiloniellaceae bacterium]
MNSLDHPTLRQFLAVAEAGTLRAAARRLNMSQPPLTARIRLLEDRLGVQLFERSVKGMRLTPAGAALAEDARALLGGLARAEAR